MIKLKLFSLLESQDWYYHIEIYRTVDNISFYDYLYYNLSVHIEVEFFSDSAE